MEKEIERVEVNWKEEIERIKDQHVNKIQYLKDFYQKKIDEKNQEILAVSLITNKTIL